jgi:hypothetical protein
MQRCAVKIAAPSTLVFWFHNSRIHDPEQSKWIKCRWALTYEWDTKRGTLTKVTRRRGSDLL